MKKNIGVFALLLLAVTMLTSCSAIAGIFKAGFATAIILIVVVIIVIIAIVTMMRKK